MSKGLGVEESSFKGKIGLIKKQRKNDAYAVY